MMASLLKKLQSLNIDIQQPNTDMRSLLEGVVCAARATQGVQAQSGIQSMEQWGAQALPFWSLSPEQMMQAWEAVIKKNKKEQLPHRTVSADDHLRMTSVGGWCAFAAASSAPLLTLCIKAKPYYEEKKTATEVLEALAKVPKDSLFRVVALQDERSYIYDLIQLSRSWLQADRRTLWKLCANNVIDVDATIESNERWLSSVLTQPAHGRLGEQRSTQWALDWIKVWHDQTPKKAKSKLIEAVSAAEDLWKWNVPTASSPAELVPSEKVFKIIAQRARDLLSIIGEPPSERLSRALDAIDAREEKIKAFKNAQEAQCVEEPRIKPLNKVERAARQETLLTAMEVKDLGVVKWCLSEEGQMRGSDLLFSKSGRRGGLLDAAFRGSKAEKTIEAMGLLEAAGFDFLRESTLNNRAHANPFRRAIRLCDSSRQAQVGEALALAQLRACRSAAMMLKDVQDWQQQTKESLPALPNPATTAYWQALSSAIEHWYLSDAIGTTRVNVTSESASSVTGETTPEGASPPDSAQRATARVRKSNRL